MAEPSISAVVRFRTFAVGNPSWTSRGCSSCSTWVCTLTGGRFLLELAKLPPHPLEQLEKLEQLRVLGQGRGIQVGIVAEASIGVDTYEDYERFVQLHRQHTLRKAA